MKTAVQIGYQLLNVCQPGQGWYQSSYDFGGLLILLD